MGALEKFLDGQELDAQDAGPVDGVWVFVPNAQVRECLSGGPQGMSLLDVHLRQLMKYSGDGVVVLSLPMMRWIDSKGWPKAGFCVAVMEGDSGVYVQGLDTMPDPSTRIAKA